MSESDDTRTPAGMQPLTYQGVAIRQRGEMLNLTDMWKAQGSDLARQPAEWMRSADAQRFIGFLAESLNLGNSQDEKLVLVTRGGRAAGTHAHWQIGLAYAKYLSPEFHMWCNTVVRSHMEGRVAPASPLASPKPEATPSVAKIFRAWASIAKLLPIDQNQAVLAAARATRNETGVDPLAGLGLTHLLAPQQDVHLTVSDIGLRLGGLSGRAVNQRLADLGFQIGTRDAKGGLVWEPTERGRPFAVMLDTGKRQGDGTPVRQLRWTATLVDQVRATDAPLLQMKSLLDGEVH